MKTKNYLLFFMLFLGIKANAQSCLTNSLKITTGYIPNSTNGNGITLSSPDQFWYVSSIDLTASSLSGIPVGAVPFSAIGVGTGWWQSVPTSPNASWITFTNNIMSTNLNTPNQIITYSRKFKVCDSADSIKLNINVQADNNVNNIRLNNVNVNINQFYHVNAGTNIISVEVQNSGFMNLNNNPTSLLVEGEIIAQHFSIVSDDSLCNKFVCSSCIDTCYWKTTGNIINAAGNNVLGTLNNKDIYVTTNNLTRGVISKNGNYGINTTSPSAFLHVNFDNGNAQTSGLSDIRFEKLESNPNVNTPLVIDANGYVFQGTPNNNNGTTYTANQGITIDGNNTIQLGDQCGNGGSPFYESREINMQNHNLYFNTTEEGKLYMGIEKCKDLTARLEIGTQGLNTENDYTPPASPSGLRFTDLTANTKTIDNKTEGVLSLDYDGDVIWVKRDGGTVINNIGITSNCYNPNMVPKVNTSAGDLSCSQLFDNGTSVGINATSGFNYSSLSGATLGSSMPPSSGTVRLQVNGVLRSLASIVTSDANYKNNINEILNPMSIIKNLNGKTYTWNSKAQEKLGADNGLHIGFIAQDLQKIIPEIVIKDNNGDLAVNYIELIPILTEGIKLQQSQIETLSATVANLQTENENIKTKLNELANCCNNSNAGDAKITSNTNILYQNTPNPFDNATSIEYFIASKTNNASIMIYDLNGKELHRFPISTIGKGKVTVDGNNLVSGIYLYSLIIDGKEIDTKRMVLAK